MKPANLARLAKILALADSSHDGEAAAAIRMARQILGQSGLSFADLARSAANLPGRKPPDFAAAQAAAKIPAQLAAMQRRIGQLQADKEAQGRKLAEAGTHTAQLEGALEKSRAEVEKWRNLARDTANQLWDLGQQIEQDRALAQGALQKIRIPERGKHTNAPAPPVELSRTRRFVRNSLLDAQDMNGAAHHWHTAE